MNVEFPKRKLHDPRMKHLAILFILIAVVVILCSSCGGVENIDDSETPGPTDTGTGELEPTRTPSPVDRIEEWMVDLEWPSSIMLGESDVIGLRLVPSETGLVIEAEFSDHKTITQNIPITRPDGYILTAVAELYAKNFEISPEGQQRRELVNNKPETFHWTITPSKSGRQRMSLALTMEWEAVEGQSPTTREFGSFSHAFEIQVTSILGMSRNGALRLVLIVIISGFLIMMGFRKRFLGDSIIQNQSPNPYTILDARPGVTLSSEEEKLLRTIFRNYQRVVLEKEFMSGYSGARTLMSIPVHANHRADARTIIKVSERASIIKEFNNYQKYVQDTLPPTTARIQQNPVSQKNTLLAGLRYTFIGMPGTIPVSLRVKLLEDPSMEWLEKLTSNYGPYWWLQNHPYTFRLCQEYDRKLPAHIIVAPSEGNVRGRLVNGAEPIRFDEFSPGEVIRLENFSINARVPGKAKLSLLSDRNHGGIPFRVTYLSETISKNSIGIVTETRSTFLSAITKNMDRFGLPDPLLKLPVVLNETVTGRNSIIHGDMNLENILVGPGDILWLIDFAETREGHTLFDFAQLYIEIIAHVISVQVESAEEFLDKYRSNAFPLLSGLRELSRKFLFDPNQSREFDLVVFVSCLGALKYSNLTEKSKQFLFMTAAYLAQSI